MTRKVPRAGDVAMAVAAMFFAACSGQTAFDRVAVHVEIYPITVATGDSVSIVVAARNLSDENVTLIFDTDCQLLYRIVAASGMQVAPANPWVCTQGRTAMVLSPGVVADTVFRWVAQVPAGTYRAYGVLGADRAREAGPALLTVQ